MTTPQDINAALDDRPVSVNPRRGLGPTGEGIFDWFVKHGSTVRTLLEQSHAPAHDAVDLEKLKDQTLYAIQDKCGTHFILHPDGTIELHPEEIVYAVIDHLAPRLARSVPVGYALVPIEPTEDMVENGIAEYALNQKTWKVEDIWEAMLSAAPQQKQGE